MKKARQEKARAKVLISSEPEWLQPLPLVSVVNEAVT
jgi:hypothetical protein